MSFERVRSYFEKLNLQDRIMEFEESSATVELAAEAVGCESKRIAKSLSFNVDGEGILIVASGDMKIDNAKYKAHFNTKARMMSPEEVETIIGHKVGGVCPFAINEGVKVYLDKALGRFDTVYPACGSANSVIELSIEELEKYSNYSEWIDVCKER